MPEPLPMPEPMAELPELLEREWSDEEPLDEPPVRAEPPLPEWVPLPVMPLEAPLEEVPVRDDEEEGEVPDVDPEAPVEPCVAPADVL
jgi:hypothetical protein